MIKLNEEEYTLQCNSNDEIIGDLKGAFSELKNENLIVNFLDNSDNSFNFTTIEDIEEENKKEENKEEDNKEEENKEEENIKGRAYKYFTNKNKSSGLSTGAIIAIILSCAGAAIITAIAIILCNRKPNPTIQNSSNISTQYRINNLNN